VLPCIGLRVLRCEARAARADTARTKEEDMELATVTNLLLVIILVLVIVVLLKKV
jgi:hypothetical protein